MKIVDGYMLKNIANAYVVVPVGSRSVDFSAIISVNETGAFIWRQLEKDTTPEAILQNMLEEYEVTEAQAKEDLDAFIQKLREAELLQE